MNRATLIDELSRFVCDPRGGETVTLTLDRDGAWETLGALAYGAAGVVLHEHHLTRVTEALEAHAQTLLAEKLHKLVADFQANGNSRELGDPTAGAWLEAAQQVLDAIAGWTDTAANA